jgi:hypothetical protein
LCGKKFQNFFSAGHVDYDLPDNSANKAPDHKGYKKNMETIVMLTNELPLVMAPATLMAALLTVSLIRAFFRFKRKPFKVMAIGVMAAISAGMIMMQSMV